MVISSQSYIDNFKTLQNLRKTILDLQNEISMG